MTSTKKFLRASGYAASAFVIGSLANEQNSANLFAIFTIASGICVAGASCLTIKGFERLKEERNRRKSSIPLPDDNQTTKSHEAESDHTP